eukprot:6157845-Alexandrium_andersonii.AAC.1
MLPLLARRVPRSSNVLARCTNWGAGFSAAGRALGVLGARVRKLRGGQARIAVLRKARCRSAG